MSTPGSSLQTNDSDPSYTKLKSNDLPWYTEDVEGQLLPEIRTLLETYSGIAPEEVIPHIKAVRSTLWNIRAYPCTGLFVFLVPWIRYHSSFEEIVSLLKASSDTKFLDVGCYIGHDLRALTFAGVEQEKLYGLDIIDFLPNGNDLFRDEGRFGMNGRFVVGDILDHDERSEAAKLLNGKMSVVWCSAILHQFPWDTAVDACKRLVEYAVGKGAVIVGAIVGSSDDEGTADMKGLTKGKHVGTEPYKHNAKSLERLWVEVAESLEVDLRITTDWKPWGEWGCDERRCKIMGADYGVLEWTVHVD